MNSKKPTLDDYIDVIIARDGGIPYPEVLEMYNITPNQFFRAVRDINYYDLSLKPLTNKIQTVKDVLSDPQRKNELFNMGQEFIQTQYDRIRNSTQKMLYYGTFIHPQNIKALVYCALTSNILHLDSNNRGEVIKSIKNLPGNLQDYFRNIRLAGLMEHAFGKNKQNSPLAILEIFDEVYQEKTGDTSLFDLSQPEHLHKWGDNLKAPNKYWRNHRNVEEAVYHTLTENIPKLTSTDRREVVNGIKSLPINIQDYFWNIGLRGLMGQAFSKGKRGSPLAVLEVFDQIYQKKTGDKSLFDLSEPVHLHRWGDNFYAPFKYWQNPRNVEEAVYHTLTENTTHMASDKRENVIQAIRSLPTNLGDYFHEIGLGGLIQTAFEKDRRDSPLAVLEVFDQIYQKKTGDKSLFDLSEPVHLHRWGVFSVPQSYWQNQANVRETVYHTLSENIPQLSSKNRKEVIKSIKNLPGNLQDYFRNIRLAGLMNNAFEKSKKSSPLAVLEVFDEVYQEKTGDKSLFDLSQKEHLHKWGDKFQAPNKYWQNPMNVEEAVYHVLTENHPELSSTNRENVISRIKALSTDLARYINSIGLRGLMNYPSEKHKKGSPNVVLEVFDRVYQRKTGDASLFDKTQEFYLEFDKSNRLTR